MIQVDPARTALILIDFQNYGLHPDGYWASQVGDVPSRAAPAVEGATEALAAARAGGLLVVHVGQAWRQGHPDANLAAPWQASAREAGRTVEGTWGVEFLAPLTPAPGELVVWKRSVSALCGTDLARLLALRGVTTLVLAGVVTNFGVEGTAREASDRGYRVIVLEDCCIAATDEEHEYPIRIVFPVIGEVARVGDLVQALA